jgi:YD repeat-containing protein
VLTEEKLANTSSPATTTYTYGLYNQIASVTDPLGNTTALILSNSLGETTAVTDPKMNTTNFLYNAQGQVTSVTDPLTNQTQFTYDHGDLVLRHRSAGPNHASLYRPHREVQPDHRPGFGPDADCPRQSLGRLAIHRPDRRGEQHHSTTSMGI